MTVETWCSWNSSPLDFLGLSATLQWNDLKLQRGFSLLCWNHLLWASSREDDEDLGLRKSHLIADYHQLLSQIPFLSYWNSRVLEPYLSASCPVRLLCRSWLELSNPGSEWFYGCCKYHRWDAALLNASLSFVNDLLMSGFFLYLHMCWTFFWWYSEGGKGLDCLSKMMLNGSQNDLVLHLDSLPQGTMWNKTLEFFLIEIRSLENPPIFLICVREGLVTACFLNWSNLSDFEYATIYQDFSR